MASSRMMAWFSTKNGRTFTYASIGVSCFGLMGLNCLLQGPFNEKLRQMTMIYRRGKPKPLTDKVQELTKEILRDSKLSDKEKENTHFFNVIGLDLCHMGALNSPWGAHIGLPFYFEEEINFNALRLHRHDSIDWLIDGQDLISALTISDKAKKFAIMREIYSLNIWNDLGKAIILPVCILFSAILARRINILRDTFNKSTLKRRMVMYVACFMSGSILYRLLKDPLRHITEKINDEQAALTGPDYLEGGIEFYEHVLMTNKALRALLGKSGERQYNVHGNLNYIIITPKLPITKRLEFLQKLKEAQIQES